MAALNAFGYSARLAEPPDCKDGMACFASPTLYDVIGPDGRKLCGGAQRRTRRGLLHQGSIQNMLPPRDFANGLLNAMATEIRAFSPTPAILARAVELVTAKYGTRTWLERR